MPKAVSQLDMSLQKVVNLGDGTGPSDAVTVGQLQAAIRGLVWKPEVKAATNGAVTLSAAQTIDGVSLVAGDRVLVKDQASAATNGIYVVASGSWSRAADLDEAAEFTNGVAVTVEQGTVNGDKAFVMATDGAVVVGTTALTFVALGGSGQSYTGSSAIGISGSVISAIVKAGGGILIDGSGLYIDPAFSGLAKRYASDVPAGNASATITHNLGTTDVQVQVVDLSSKAVVMADVVITSANVVTLGFGVAPTTGQYRVIVQG